MKKLCNRKGQVHPAPPPPASWTAAWGHLVALPAAMLALAATLAPEEQEVLAYLLTGAGAGVGRRRWKQHPPELGCGCFGCYKSFWARWDASPNRHVIHRIIEAMEADAEMEERGRRCGGRRRRRSGTPKGGELLVPPPAEAAEGGNSAEEDEVVRQEDGEDINGGAGNSDGDGGIETKNSVRRLVSFICERVWRAWN